MKISYFKIKLIFMRKILIKLKLIFTKKKEVTYFVAFRALNNVSYYSMIFEGNYTLIDFWNWVKEKEKINEQKHGESAIQSINVLTK